MSKEEFFDYCEKNLKSEEIFTNPLKICDTIGFLRCAKLFNADLTNYCNDLILILTLALHGKTWEEN